MKKTIDIALASYNGASYIREQLESILRMETGSDACTLRYIIVSDNGSRDETAAIVTEMAAIYPQIRLVTEQRKGVIANFNRAISESDADYVMLSDQDDVWLPEKLTVTINQMLNQEKQSPGLPVLVFTDLRVVDAALNTIAPSFFGFQKVSPADYAKPERMAVYNIAPGCTMMLNRALLQTAMPVPETCYMHDWWFVHAAAIYGRLAWLDQQTMLYRQHANNQVGARHSGFWEKFFSPVAKFREAHKNFSNASRHCAELKKRYPGMPEPFRTSVFFVADFFQLTRWDRLQGLRRRFAQAPTKGGALLLLLVALLG
ncbi:glycosyltransferase family 2 protein [Undibacterium luofuense]|uniref:Glycosyltransferase family 2 protein n=1 Tax=Undibacterium luofuense TaxID=2828733 RepID=A0A941I9U5_9BURK|nr:glycosyltransferase family 2 protein [Undibacterium luofuense]MBR7784178.1 glycosyltransferase family 2 protein [Undibacterium luofuense]